MRTVYAIIKEKPLSQESGFFEKITISGNIFFVKPLTD